MKPDFWLEQIPLWGVFAITVTVVLLSVWMGRFFGSRGRRQPEHEAESSLTTITGATLGLLAFMLAFTFGMAAERFQARRQLLLDEVNAIGTTYLRAGLLLEPHRSDVQKLLREYVDIRTNLARESPNRQAGKLRETISRSEMIHNRLWSHAAALAQADHNSEIDALFIRSLNEMIDLHNSRLTVFMYRIPTPIWYVLYLITILSMVMVGYQAELSGKSSVKVIIVLALTFSAVVFLIADLDSPLEGSLRVSQQPMLELQKTLQIQTQETGEIGKILVPPEKVGAGNQEK